MNFARAIGLSVSQAVYGLLEDIINILNFWLYVFSSQECLGFHLGNPQSANLGDGNGFVDETVKTDLDVEINTFFIVFSV